MKYKVTRRQVEIQVVESTSPELALELANQYENQYNWYDESTVYTVQEVSE